jgi:NAD-dependent SIR2 family protein deacetylase
MLVIGTSGVVVPVAHLPFLAKDSGGRIVLVDPNDIGPLRMISSIHIKEKAVKGVLTLERSLKRSY